MKEFSIEKNPLSESEITHILVPDLRIRDHGRLQPLELVLVIDRELEAAHARLRRWCRCRKLAELVVQRFELAAQGTDFRQTLLLGSLVANLQREPLQLLLH